jgi:hypothetical protein
MGDLSSERIHPLTDNLDSAQDERPNRRTQRPKEKQVPALSPPSIEIEKEEDSHKLDEMA